MQFHFTYTFINILYSYLIAHTIHHNYHTQRIRKQIQLVRIRSDDRPRRRRPLQPGETGKRTSGVKIQPSSGGHGERDRLCGIAKRHRDRSQQERRLRFLQHEHERKRARAETCTF